MKHDLYTDGLLEIASLYRENKPLIRDMIARFDSPVSVLEEIYRILVKEKEIDPIENLPEVKKRELWNEAVVNQKRRLSVVKALYVLEII